jgi:Tfp pilus assembly protein PilN
MLTGCGLRASDDQGLRSGAGLFQHSSFIVQRFPMRYTMNAPSSPNELSFLPEDYLERKARRRANLLCGALSVIVMGTIGSAFAACERSMRSLDTAAAEVDRQYDEAGARIAQVEKLHAAQKQLVQHAELAATLVERVPRTNILAELTNALPTGTSLLEFYMESNARPAAPSQNGEAKKADERPVLDVKMRIAGIADNDVQVAQFINKLNHSNLFKDVNLVITDSFVQDKTMLRRFQIDMLLNPNAEIHDESAPAKLAAVGASE